jgi:hypothetical protein
MTFRKLLIEKLARDLIREGGEVPKLKKSKKASARVTAPNEEASAAAAEAKTASRRKAARSSAVENVARRQFQKTQAAATQGHTRARGQRQQAKRDAR